jgi:D-alanyl-lipoteichoic acid acyltransferase DltB (MBOAT superfamily)
MGYDLMLNFRQPYLAQSTRDFWARWHISLSSWFRDYVYIPLGGNRGSRLYWYRNLFLTFLVSGLWHGASWTFVLWGALHGAYLVAGAATLDARQQLVSMIGLDRFPRVLAVMRTLITFHMVLAAWVLFRANTLADAFLVFTRLAELPAQLLSQPLLMPPFESGRDVLFLVAILVASSFHHLQRPGDSKWLRASGWKTAGLALQFWFIVVYGVFDNKQFIYFQF